MSRWRKSGPELIAARLAQGATAALMVPQVLATIHLLFADASRARAFGIYGIVLGWPARPASCSAAFWSRSISRCCRTRRSCAGLVAVFFFFFANLSFYLVMTMFMQKGCIFHRCRPAWSSCPWR